uniref:Uncharacterized protein n=1 Tax=Anguilla anguilla TaxID=7936 RepID=A0A0E9X5L6_ANGAN
MKADKTVHISILTFKKVILNLSVEKSLNFNKQKKKLWGGGVGATTSRISHDSGLNRTHANHPPATCLKVRFRPTTRLISFGEMLLWEC